MFCTQCGSQLEEAAAFCPKCGSKVSGPSTKPVCVQCGAEVGPGAEFCAKCGYRLVAAPVKPGPDEMYCSSCGAIIRRQAEICVKCGVRVLGGPWGVPAETRAGEFSPKSRLTAGILGILLGGIGVHRFYLGYIGTGIIQIIVTIITLGIGSLWGFIEGIIIIAGGRWKDAQGLPIRKYNE